MGPAAFAPAARPLYWPPRLHSRNEGTSHLDIATERQVTAAVKALELTRVIIAHRPETIASAPRQLVLCDGELHEIRESRAASLEPRQAA